MHEVYCGTGHRPDKLGGYGEDVFQRLVALAQDFIQGTLPSYLITGGALGWDQALAEAARREKVEYAVYVPFVEFDCKWPQASRDRLKSLIQAADEVVVCCDPGYAGWKMQERNKQMVNNADKVLALWNGTDGGTANCVRYANKNGTEVVNLWNQWADGFAPR